MATLPIRPTGSPAVPAPTLPTIGTPTTAATATTNPLATNPIAGTNSGATVPTTPATPSTTTSAIPGTSIGSTLSTVDGSNTLVGDFSDTYGKGTGTALAGVLSTLGTSTDAAVSSTNAAINQQADRSLANIGSADAAAGISPNSSSAALATGYFDSDVATTIASTDSQMELSEENTLINQLQQEGAAHGPDGSTFDAILGGIGDAGEIAGALALL